MDYLCTFIQLTAAINTLEAIRSTVLIHSLHVWKPSQYSVIHSTRQLLSLPALLPTSSFLTPSICNTPTKLLKHFISGTIKDTFFKIPYVFCSVQSLWYTSCRDFALIPIPLLLSTLFRAPHCLYQSLILGTHPYHILHPLPLATQVLKKSTSSYGLPFCLTCIRPHLHTTSTSLLC